MKPQQLDLPAVRERLAGLNGRQFWRSLEELAETKEFEELLHREFPRQASGWMGPVTRRQFLKVMGASLALAGLTGCAPSQAEKIVPYVEKPEELIPGNPLFFATAMPIGGFATGLLVESQMGRPIKVEGNPQHPASLGATQPFHQASVLGLYDPDRSQAVINLGRISTWDSFVSTMTGRMEELRGNGGAGFRILTETVTSPTLAAQIRALLEALPQARWHQWEPVARHNANAGARQAFGRDVNTIYRFDHAARILSLDADFLYTLPGNLTYARAFIDRRRVDAGQQEMNRLYVVESTPTITGAMADHRLPVRAQDVAGIARAIARGLGVDVGADGGAPANLPQGWVDAVVRDLRGANGASIIVAGEDQPAGVHALAHAMNAALGNAGRTVIYTDAVEADPADQLESLRELVGEMSAGRVSTLLMLGGNPVYTAPADFRFREALAEVQLAVHLSQYADETSELSHWHIPEAHYLEAWGDARAFDGTVSIIQPLIAPLYAGRSAHELLATLLGEIGTAGYDIVRGFWQGQFDQPAGLLVERPADTNFEDFWRRALHDGVVAGTALPPIQAGVQAGFAAGADGTGTPAQGDQGLELIFRRDPAIWDGRFANNGWLQELPKHMTTLTWDNPVLISPATAQQLNVKNQDLVELRFREGTLPAAVWVTPGHPDNTVTLYLGYGRTRAGRVGDDAGFNAYFLRTSDALNFGSGLEIRPLGQTYVLAPVQEHAALEGRGLVRVATLPEFIENPEFAQDEVLTAIEPEEVETGEQPEGAEGEGAEGEGAEGEATEGEGAEGEGTEAGDTEGAAEGRQLVPEPPSLYPEWKYEGYAWGMAINLQACIGCNACVVACQAENNIPVVGKEQVTRSREMHWLKVDRYYEGDPENPSTYFQPRPCMHCENAPCEPVCPVQATSHSAEGLNEMTYNRCVGTRYCSNNCPYKVRRFNFLDYTKQDEIPVLQLAANPDVTIRARGVMEKCTYCVQRINVGRIEAKREGRRIQDGEVKTACQEACPTQAIVFGDINDPNSEVTRLKLTELNYGMLAEIGTQPRTTYLARVQNPNPEITTG